MYSFPWSIVQLVLLFYKDLVWNFATQIYPLMVKRPALDNHLLSVYYTLTVINLKIRLSLYIMYVHVQIYTVTYDLPHYMTSEYVIFLHVLDISFFSIINDTTLFWIFIWELCVEPQQFILQHKELYFWIKRFKDGLIVYKMGLGAFVFFLRKKAVLRTIFR